MNFEYFIGIDCSKETLDYALVTSSGEILAQGKLDNKLSVVKAFFQKEIAKLDVKLDKLLVCVETTGIYTNHLKVVATDQDFFLWCQDALEVKLRSGRQKGKTDALDAVMIANYAMRYVDQAQRFVMPEQVVLQIKEVSRQRSRLLQDISAWKVRLGESKKFSIAKGVAAVDRILSKHIKEGDKAIKEIDIILTKLIKADEKTKRKYKITLSNPGFGAKNTITVMAETGMFDDTPNGKACASYAGLTPNQYESGTSVKRSARTSKACNKRLKTAIHLGAMSLIKHDNIYQQLYNRLRERGRKHLQAVNAVRNKMVTVLYACLRDDVMYQKNLHKRLDLP